MLKRVLLFNVPNDTRVRITSKTIRYKSGANEPSLLKSNVTWEGTTTNLYRDFAGGRRRYIRKPKGNLPHPGKGIWCTNIECEVK